MSKLDEVPIFYHYEECGGGVVVIDYWIWYSHQAACLKLKAGGIMDETYGEHRADWERVAVHIRDDKVKRVRYHQHSGSYTKKRKNVEFVDSKHPVAYVGQDSHGSYHDQGGTGNCLYFQDFRRFDDPRLKVEGWKFLISIKNESDALPEWFDGERQYLDSFPPPAQLKGRSGCDMSSCSGKDDWVEATETCAGVSCGCHKSDYCDDIKFGAISDEKPCEQTLINEVTSEAKDRLKGLFGSAQVSSTSKLNALRAVAFALGLLACRVRLAARLGAPCRVAIAMLRVAALASLLCLAKAQEENPLNDISTFYIFLAIVIDIILLLLCLWFVYFGRPEEAPEKPTKPEVPPGQDAKEFAIDELQARWWGTFKVPKLKKGRLATAASDAAQVMGSSSSPIQGTSNHP
eukprot:Skav216031  [mRNA]  locus=scaffold2403:13000:19042:- [translate_table: standard]